MQATALFTLDDLRPMHLQPVMVNPGERKENPPVGMRGTIWVSPEGEVDLVLDFAVMFDRPAAKQTIRLTPAQVEILRAAKAREGEYAITLDQPIEVPPTRDYVVKSPRL